MFKKSALFATALVALSILVFACGAPMPVPMTGDVWVLQSGTTQYWIDAALRGQTGTYILQKGSDLLFLWPMKDQGVGFTMISQTAQNSYAAATNWERATGGKGNLINYLTAKGMVDYLKSQGWRFVRAKEITQKVSYGIRNALGDIRLFTIFVMPAGVLPDQNCPPGYIQCSGWE
jgi:hypothetical protein